MGGFFVKGDTLEGSCNLGKGNTCSANGNVHFTRVATGIAPINTGADFSVYPNPFSGQLQIKVANPTNNMQVDLFDMFGRKLYSQQWNSTPGFNLALGALSSGVYLLTLTAEGNTVTRRIVKE